MSGVLAESLDLPPTIQLEPMDGPCGVTLHGVDLSDDLSGEEIGALLAVANHAGLVHLPGQNRLNPARQAEISEWFGRIFLRDGEVDRIATVAETPVQILGSEAFDAEGAVPGADMDRGQPLPTHSDVQDYAITPDFTILHCVETPPAEAGGRTYWSDLYRAHDELDEATRELVTGRRWVPPSTAATAAGVGMQAAKRAAGEAGHSLDSEVRQPVVRTHPVTRRRALWVSSFTTRVEGVGSEQDEQALATRLRDHVNQDPFWTMHDWTAGDVVIWDNRCVNHRRDGWDPSYRRTMHRSQAGAARPF
jgi:taurine dioxygenase